jgi:hypothetical protein
VGDLSGVQKAGQAQGAILLSAKQMGLSASTSIINMLIELAVQFVKGNLEAVGSAVTPPTSPSV